MTTPDIADPPAKSTDVTRTLMRGSWYLIEGLLQRLEPPGTSPDVQRRGNRLWLKVRKSNPCKLLDAAKEVVIDFEEPRVRKADETETSWNLYLAERNAAYDKWQQQPLAVVLSSKMNKLLDEVYIRWALKNRDKVWKVASEYTLEIMDSFDVGTSEESE